MQASRSTSSRIASIDALRGLIMVIMALDHVRDFWHFGAQHFQPTDLSQTTVPLFFTRWVTHFCAPVFMVTAGMGAYYWSRKHTKRELSVFLLTRGAWLVLLEITVMRFSYDFTLGKDFPILLLVLWAIGLCMICLAGLVWLPKWLIGVVSVGMIVLHNAWAGPVMLHRPGAITLLGHVCIAAYPLIPWVGVMALGFLLADRKELWFKVGLAATIAFVVLRVVNVYGDPVPRNANWLSFFNVTKYPPSLEFLCMTLGPALMVMDKLTWQPLVTIGRVPLFYYVIHFYLAHIGVVVATAVKYGVWVWKPVPSMGGPADAWPAGFGFPLWGVYLAWMSIVLVMYPLCRWYAGVKSGGKWWLSYL